MTSRVKEEEKNERIIRSLLKLPDNKRCINCNSLGPQYVCITFWTFVCTNCSGIHREYTHRVKSISMAKFTSQEVIALQEGGNQRAKDIYFRGLDQQRQSVPDGSNVERLRDFIRHVYVNKKYTNEKNDDNKPPRGQTSDNSETRSSSGSRSPPYGDAYERRSSPGGGGSPGFEETSRKFGDFKKSPARHEVVNDWRREDRFGGRKTSLEEGSQSPPEQVKNSGSASPPLVRPVREILGDSVIPLCVGEPPKPPHVNRNTDSKSPSTPTIENPPQVKVETALSLIDFDTDPEPIAPSTSIQAAQPTLTPQPTNDDNWASFDVLPSASNLSVAQSPPPSGNTLDSLFSQLAVTSSEPVLPHSHSQLPPNGNSSEQQWNTAFPSIVQSTITAPSLPPVQGVVQSSEVKPIGRTELPADLFTLTYPSYQQAVPGWQQPHGMQHFGMQQYNNPMVQPFQNFPQPGKSHNPFDLSTQTQPESMFPPSMGLLQGALPPSGMMPSHPSAMPPRYNFPQMPGSIPPSNLNNMGAQQTFDNMGAIPSNPQSFQSGGNPFG